MSERDHLTHVRDMIQAIDKIFKYLESVSGLEDFLGNDMVVDAVTGNYEIIGEAANKVPKALIKGEISATAMEADVRTTQFFGP